MTVVGSLAIDGAKQIELFDDLGGLETENFPDRALQFFLVHLSGAESINADAYRFGMTDGIGELNFTSVRQAGCDDILRHPASHVSGATIHFRWVFSGKRATAVTSHSAIGITDDFAAGDARVALGTANYEPACWIDQIGSLRIKPFRRHHFLDEKFSQSLADFFLFHVLGVLRRNNYGCGSHRFITIVLDRDLRLCVRSQPGNFAGFAESRELAPEFVGERVGAGISSGVSLQAKPNIKP